ncbi:MAG: ABC transporter ATP-binding protein [Candidatus Eisenbacteria bacterium]|nr:ABC transporter ATP-binding protein [Candidatus Eisenbacteria bacterium]
MNDSPGTGVVLRAERIEKSFITGSKEIKVLLGVDLDVRKGEVFVIVGPSGAGKSTLLHILGTLERPTSGVVYQNGRNVFLLSDDDLARLRNKEIGFVFQFHHLLPEFDAAENVMLPALLGGLTKREARKLAEEFLDEVGLADRASHRPGELSIGEQQRVAVARALVNSPQVVLADEPTGSLDRESAAGIHTLLKELSERRGETFVVATHNDELVSIGSRVSRLMNGRLVPAEKVEIKLKDGVR